MAVAFDEMNGPGGDIRPAYQELSRWLKETPPDALEYRRQEAELLFRRIGITFAVYGDSEATERLIPFDVIPRIMAAISQRLRGIPDLKWEIKEVLISGNHVIVRGEATGTPAGEMMGTPTNGKSFKLMSLDLHTIEGNKIARTYHVEDWQGAFRQVAQK